jgi:hypothetical protein
LKFLNDKFKLVKYSAENPLKNKKKQADYFSKNTQIIKMFFAYGKETGATDIFPASFKHSSPLLRLQLLSLCFFMNDGMKPYPKKDGELCPHPRACILFLLSV